MATTGMASIDATSLSMANSSQTIRLLWTVARSVTRSVTTPADQHKTQVNRFFFFLLDHTNKIHFFQACKKYRIGKLCLLIIIIQTNDITNSEGVAIHMVFFRKFCEILNYLCGLDFAINTSEFAILSLICNFVQQTNQKN